MPPPFFPPDHRDYIPSGQSAPTQVSGQAPRKKSHRKPSFFQKLVRARARVNTWKNNLLRPLALVFRAAMPKSLLARSLLIIVTPLVVLQVITATIFFDRHWETMSWRLNSAVASEVGLIIEILDRNPDPKAVEALLSLVRTTQQMTVRLLPGNTLETNEPPVFESTFVTRTLARTLAGHLRWPYEVGMVGDRELLLCIQRPDGVVEIEIPRKRLFSGTVYVFIAWMTISSVILFGVATIFMRNQIRPVRRLAEVADALGKGHDVQNFSNRGATEVMRVGSAFIRMRDRLRRQISQRTEMLAGVSHDLRTPLTRMRLQLAMMGNRPELADMEDDIAEMERLIEGYLAFARGEGTEESVPIVITDLVEGLVQRLRRSGAYIDLHLEQPLTVRLKPHATERCLTNVIGNAVRYGHHVAVRVGARGQYLEILVDDDGPGIPPDQREEVFRAFVRLENSRNPRTGGTGLGLTIAKDLAHAMGGDITLESSPMGGLRARIRFPL